MRTEVPLGCVRVSSLIDLDALVGEHLMEETPHTHWEDAHSKLLFDSVEEAMEAFHDPYLRQFVNGETVAATVLTEVKEFRRYSADLEAAWDLIARVSERFGALNVRREDGQWSALFGQRPGALAGSAPVAICLAALRAHGIEIECVADDLKTYRDASDGSPAAAAIPPPPAEMPAAFPFPLYSKS